MSPAPPKPVKQEKQRKAWRRKNPQPKAPSAALAFPKPLVLVDTTLLKKYEGAPCRLCGKRDTHAHHLVPRSFQRLDIQQNLIPLCTVCHDEVEKSGEEGEQKVAATKTPGELALLRALTPMASIWTRIEIGG